MAFWVNYILILLKNWLNDKNDSMFLNGNYNWLSPFLFLNFPLPCYVAWHWLIACCALVFPSWWCLMACCCDTYHAPFRRTCHGCINAPPSRVLLPWFPTESAHDARCYTYHCVCSNSTCHQRSLRCCTYRQSGLAIYFTCWDLVNYIVLLRHSICL